MSERFAVFHNQTDSGLRVRLARSFRQRLMGLLGQQGLAPHDGLWIQPCDRVHTFGMRFAIDLVMLDQQGSVLSATSELPPWRLGPKGQRHGMALELACGEIRRLRVCVGDRLTLGDP